MGIQTISKVWTSRETALAVAGALIISGWALLARLTGGGTRGSIVLEGVLFGTLFGQVTLAASFVALGPLRLIVRLPVALLWLAAVTLALAAGKAPSPIDARDLLVAFAAIFLQWILVLLPLWLLARLYSMRIIHPNEPGKLRGDKQQFGIRQLMALTALVAGFLSASRLLIGGLHWQEPGSSWKENAWIFGMLVVANAVLALPTVGAGLLRRRRVLLTVIALFFSSCIAMLEVYLYGFLRPVGPSRNDLAAIFLTLNWTQGVWVLVIIAVLRAGGFRLTFSLASARLPR